MDGKGAVDADLPFETPADHVFKGAAQQIPVKKDGAKTDHGQGGGGLAETSASMSRGALRRHAWLRCEKPASILCVTGGFRCRQRTSGL